MDFSLNKSQISLVRLVRDLVEQEIRPYARSHNFDSKEDFDWHLVHVLGEQNLICPTIPTEFGGLGLDFLTTALIIEEIAAACPGLAAVIDTNVHAMGPILLAGSQRQKEAFLPRLTGPQAKLAAFAITEPTGGSDLEAMTTFAARTDKGFILNGRKDYILNAPVADLICVFAMADHFQKKSSMRCFIVPRSTPGLQIGSIRHMAALDYARMAEIILDDTEITTDLVIKGAEPYSGYLLLSQTFDIGRVLVGATSVGIARAAYEMASDYSEKRVQFGRPIRKHQAVAHALVDMARKIEMARLLTWKACWLIDQGDDYTVASATAKLSASIIAQEVTSMAADILGARAYEKGSFMEELQRDARILSTIEGTNLIQRNIIASLL